MGAAGCYLWVEDAGYHLQVEVVECNPQTKLERRWVVPEVEVEFFHLEAEEDRLSHLRSTIIPLHNNEIQEYFILIVSQNTRAISQLEL